MGLHCILKLYQLRGFVDYSEAVIIFLIKSTLQWCLHSSNHVSPMQCSDDDTAVGIVEFEVIG